MIKQNQTNKKWTNCWQLRHEFELMAFEVDTKRIDQLTLIIVQESTTKIVKLSLQHWPQETHIGHIVLQSSTNNAAQQVNGVWIFQTFVISPISSAEKVSYSKKRAENLTFTSQFFRTPQSIPCKHNTIWLKSIKRLKGP